VIPPDEAAEAGESDPGIPWPGGAGDPVGGV